MTVVLELGTNEKQLFSCSPEEAVIAAHAQSLKDFNTWDYQERYGDKVVTGEFSVACGDFAALLLTEC